MPLKNNSQENDKIAVGSENPTVCDRIFEYDNYREFLQDYFEEQRKHKSFFSHRYFAQKAGFNSHSFCAYIMDGKRNLSHESIKKMVKGLGLAGKKADYFEALVDYNQSLEDEEREKFYKNLQRLRKATEFYRVNAKQLAYYDHWYYPVVRELAVYSDWNGDFEKLANLVRPAIPVEDAEKAIKTLLEIGMLELREDGLYYQPSQVVTAEKIPGYIFKNARRDFIRKAIEASEIIPKSERHISYSILAMSRKTFDEASKLIDEVRKKILVLAMEDEQVDGVFDLNIQMFPLTQFLNPKEK
jgi:uncharacterized protein (TIGR02147 family)